MELAVYQFKAAQNRLGQVMAFFPPPDPRGEIQGQFLHQSENFILI
jgi:hypothetical protein